MPVRRSLIAVAIVSLLWVHGSQRAFVATAANPAPPGNPGQQGNPQGNPGQQGTQPGPEAKPAEEEKAPKMGFSRKEDRVVPNAYCLELRREPPDAGMVFRVADGRIQEQYEPMRRILRAGRRLEETRQLTPDSNPTAYFDSIRQWALWTREQKFNLNTFTENWVAYTRKNVLAAGQPWTKDAEQVVRRAAPHRWDDISTIIREADTAGADAR